MLYDKQLFKLYDVRFVGFFTARQHFPSVAYVVTTAFKEIN